jgi:hypothetical protein
VLGDDVAGVAVARDGRGTADRGQGDNGQKARPDSCPPFAHSFRDLFFFVGVVGVVACSAAKGGDGVV